MHESSLSLDNHLLFSWSLEKLSNLYLYSFYRLEVPFSFESPEMANQLRSHPSFKWWARDVNEFSDAPPWTPSSVGSPERIPPQEDHLQLVLNVILQQEDHLQLLVTRQSSVSSEHISVMRTKLPCYGGNQFEVRNEWPAELESLLTWGILSS